MADYAVEATTVMEDQTNSGSPGRHEIAGYPGGMSPWSAPVPEFLWPDDEGEGVWAAGTPVARTPRNFGGQEDTFGPKTDWFNFIHVLPEEILAGVVLNNKIFTVQVYSSYRKTDQTWTSITNNVDAGVLLGGIPTLPTDLGPQEGDSFTVTVTPDGSSVISGTIDLVFAVRSVAITVTGTRSVVLPFEPQAPLMETLMFATSVLRGRAGTEQRIALRHVPRSRLELDYRLEGADRRKFEAFIFDGQARVFGIPMWWEGAVLTQPITASDTTITVDSTQYTHLVAGRQAIVWADADNTEVLTIDSVTPTTITFTSGFVSNFSAGAVVYPLFLGQVKAKGVKARRYPLNVDDYRLVLTSTDNSLDLASTAGFPSTFNSKVLVDDGNMIEGRSTSHTSERQVFVMDNTVGKFEVFTDWDVSRRSSTKIWQTVTRQKLWEVRQLLHALRGRQISFYLPTFREEVIPTASVTSGGTTLTIENIGYSSFYQDRQPRNVVRLTKTDGTTVARTVNSSSEISAAEEQLVVSSAWGVDANTSEIQRVEFLEEVRINSDEIRIMHQNGVGQARITVPVVSVLE